MGYYILWDIIFCGIIFVGYYILWDIIFCGILYFVGYYSFLFFWDTTIRYIPFSSRPHPVTATWPVSIHCRPVLVS